MNIIFGKNAQGKTNVLEGIFMFAGGKSFPSRKGQGAYFNRKGNRQRIRYNTATAGVKTKCFASFERKEKGMRYERNEGSEIIAVYRKFQGGALLSVSSRYHPKRPGLPQGILRTAGFVR